VAADGKITRHQQKWRVSVMRTRLIAVFVVFSVLGLILAAQLGAFQTGEPRIIPLSTAYATFNQQGIKSADDATGGEDLAQVLSAIREAPPQIVLCVGTDMIAAVKSATPSFSVSGESVLVVAGSTSEKIWVAAYLGTDGSIPPAYRIHAVELRDKTIRIVYERDQSPARSCDLHAYLVWVPIGPIEAGSYTVELFDKAVDGVTATRRCDVTVK
jgi:hypothetical protein